jgi:hypothetical protein
MFFTRWSDQRVGLGFIFCRKVGPGSQLHRPDTEASQIAEVYLSDRIPQDEGRVTDGDHIVGADSTLSLSSVPSTGGYLLAESVQDTSGRAYRNRVAHYKERYGRGIPSITTQAIGEELGYFYCIIYFFVYID